MPDPEFSVAMSNVADQMLQKFLLRPDGQEDLTLCLWTPSQGEFRQTALLHTPVLPEPADRQVHGNVSFNSSYIERAAQMAMQQQCGLALLHSHPGPGWQSMSLDDHIAESKWAGAIESLTDYPFVGLTLGTDGTWSARFWEHVSGRKFKERWCRNVRSAGERLRVSFADRVVRRPAFQEMFKRTIVVWGEKNHATLARLRIGIVGLGSVGSLVAETLARMGMQFIVLIDFDEVQEHNLDRLVTATRKDLNRLKVDVTEERMRESSTAAHIDIRKVPYSVVEERGYRAALDCDVIFSCVDRPRARKILNHIAYAHVIPVIDGGIAVRFKKGEFNGVDWQLQTVAPSRPCLECIGQFTSDDASTEEAGFMDDPSYLQGLPNDHGFKRNENVFLFSENLASLEVLQMVELCTGIGGIHDYGIQRFRSNIGTLEYDVEKECSQSCGMDELVAQGDRYFHLYGKDKGADIARARQAKFLR
ncbi:MAG TPA: ThiF family adenylyltransferase [Terriglobales bacterium]|nr:ThiF family adenylyltransferase [Terriglobales bacterium]